MKLRWWNDVRNSLSVSSQSFSDQALALGPRPVPIGIGTDEVWNGTSGDDVKNGTNGDDTLNGLAGNDTIDGRKGNDDITGGLNNDTLKGGKGNDTIHAGSGTDPLVDGGDGDDVIIIDAAGGTITNLQGGNGNDTMDASGVAAGWFIAGGAGIEHWILSNFNDTFFVNNTTDETWEGRNGNDVIDASGGNDTILGQIGDDRLYGGLGDDTLDGGDNFDLAIFNTTTTGVKANLTTGKSTGEGTDTLISIEGLLGSIHDDKLTGDGNGNHFAGFEGNDIIDGKGGIDTLFYNSIPPGGGGVVVNLQTGTASGALGNDTISNIEYVVGGGGADTITGDSNANALYGGDGVDTIFGGQGNDFIYGGNGIDTLTGGRGTDTLYGGVSTDLFVFSELGNPLPVTHYLPDAVAGETIDFSDIDAIPGGGDQAFIVFESFTGAPGVAIVDYDSINNQTVIQLDINGGASPQAEFIVRINGNHITGSSPETYDLTIIW